jgi:hypothetical protein
MVEQVPNVVHVFEYLFDVEVVHLDEDRQQLAEPIGHFEQSRQNKQKASNYQHHIGCPKGKNNQR